MKVEVGFAYSRKWFKPFAWLINFFQDIDASHTYLSYQAEGGYTRFLDATFHTVRLRLSYYFTKDYDIRRSYYTTLDSEQTAKFKSWVGLSLGKPYSIVQVLGLFFKVVGLSRINIFRGKPNYMICNELALEFVRDFLDVRLDKNINDYDLDETQEILDDLVASGRMYRGRL